MSRLALVPLVGVVLALFAVAPSTAAGSCVPRVLVLSAFPAELDALLAKADLNAAQTVFDDGRAFYVGTLQGNNVVMGLTGIGLLNAEHTTKLALQDFRCGSKPGINAVVFSGVSGGRTYIGDVTVPRRWTLDEGKTWSPVDPAMLALAKRVAKNVKLTQDAALGDCACVGVDPHLVNLVHFDHVPQVIIGGNGRSSDPFNGRAFPCVPGGGDVFGCEACSAPVHQPPDVARFANGIAPFIDPDFFTGYFEQPPTASEDFDADDMETAAAARVATQNKLPFIAFRALSDGLGDPLMLPGFPVQFFAYRQISADNAGSMASAFLKAWAQR